MKSKNDVFDIKNIKFGCKIIDIKEVEDMILQIAKGHCDHLFFAEVDSYFTANLRLNSIRGIAKKFVNEVLVKSEYDNEKMMVTYPKDWFNNFTYGEKLNIGVFKEMIAASEYFDDKGHTIPEKFVRLNKEIELGLWDIYLSWDYNTYSNIISQNKVNNALIQQFMGTNINSSQHEISESK